MTIAFTGRLALTNSGSNAHVFHYVRHSKSGEYDGKAGNRLILEQS